MVSRHEISPTDERLPQIVGVLDDFSRLLVRLPNNHGCTLTELGVLRLLDQQGPQRITELAVKQELTQPGMTQLITRMERAGLVSRVPDPHDRRAVQVVATEAGQRITEQRRAERLARFTELHNQLHEKDRERLLDALPVLARLIEIKEAASDA